MHLQKLLVFKGKQCSCIWICRCEKCWVKFHVSYAQWESEMSTFLSKTKDCTREIQYSQEHHNHFAWIPSAVTSSQAEQHWTLTQLVTVILIPDFGFLGSISCFLLCIKQCNIFTVIITVLIRKLNTHEAKRIQYVHADYIQGKHAGQNGKRG